MAAVSAVLFRCDGGPAVGLGHVSRCIALAQAFDAAGVQCRGFIAPPVPALQHLVEATGFTFMPASAAQDMATTARHAGDALVVLDGYAFGPPDVAQLRGHGVNRVLLVDDMGAWSSWPVDYVVAFTAMSVGRPFAGSVAFVGPQFTPIKRNYWRRRAAPTAARRTPESCVIALGGLDLHNQLAAIAHSAARHFAQVTVANAGILAPAVQQALRQEPAVVLLPRLADLAEQLAVCGVCVCGGGMTKYEAIFMGAPSLVVNQTALQGEDTALLVRQGLVDSTPPDGATIATRLAALAQSAPRRHALAAACATAGFGNGMQTMIHHVCQKGRLGAN